MLLCVNWLGLKFLQTVDFPSLMPIIKKQAKGEKYIFGAYKDVQRMVRSDKYKLIVYPKAKQIQLFDIVNDPHEKVNLYTVSEYAKVKRELFAAMKELQRNTMILWYWIYR